jgi:hypothetical protein
LEVKEISEQVIPAVRYKNTLMIKINNVEIQAKVSCLEGIRITTRKDKYKIVDGATEILY